MHCWCVCVCVVQPSFFFLICKQGCGLLKFQTPCLWMLGGGFFLTFQVNPSFFPVFFCLFYFIFKNHCSIFHRCLFTVSICCSEDRAKGLAPFPPGAFLWAFLHWFCQVCRNLLLLFQQEEVPACFLFSPSGRDLEDVCVGGKGASKPLVC